MLIVLCGSSFGSVAFGAQKTNISRVFREGRATRGNTSVVRLQPIDEAAWIWMPGDSGMARLGESALGNHPSGGSEMDPVFLKFRRTFEVNEGDGKLVVDVSADERYVLACDGVFVSRGPNRSTVENWQYSTYEIDLGPGRHVMEAWVWKTGDKGPLAQMSWRGGFVLKAGGVYDARLTTGVAAWEVGRLSGIEPMGTDNDVWGTGAQWRIRGAGILSGEPAEWRAAEVVRGFAGVRETLMYGLRTNGWMLFPSQLPDQTESVVRPGRAVAATKGAGWRGLHVYTEAESRAGEVAAFNDFLSGRAESFTVPAHTRLQIAWNLGPYVCAYPVAELGPSKGARLSWCWTEATKRGDTKRKTGEPGARDAIVGRYLEGYGDVFEPDAEKPGVFTTPWFRCGKWCRVDVETADAPLEIRDLRLIESRYPLEDEAGFASPQDPSLADIRRISLRAMQMCCHEMLFDCPYYEQQMYPGDTRVQLNVISALTRDDRIVKRAIELYDLGSRDDGQCPYNWPTRGTQEGASYTLCYLCMYGDYVMKHTDREWLRARIPGFRRSLAGMELYENAEGLLENLPGWSFVDWAEGWRRGNPPGGLVGEGVNAELNLFWLLAMQSAVTTERALGNELQARYWEAKEERLKAKIVGTFWCAERGLLADTPAMKDFSEHAQCLAIVAGALPADREEEAFRHLVSDADLTRCTVYFSYYLFDAYFRHGRGDLFLKRLDLWRDYVRRGLTTTQEAPDSPTKGESRSDCHAWGAHPIWWTETGLAGIRSAAPFFERVLVAPCPGGLGEISASYPHPEGQIEVKLSFAGGRASGSVTTPVPGEFAFGVQRLHLGKGSNKID